MYYVFRLSSALGFQSYVVVKYSQILEERQKILSLHCAEAQEETIMW
jgi:hypothetical protein